MKNIIIFAFIFLSLIAWQAKNRVYQPGPLDEAIYVVIEKGSGTSSVATTLSNAGVISHPVLFRLAARVFGLDKQLKAGEYLFLPKISMYQAIQKISNGEIAYRKITLPEGLTSAQIVNLINQENLLSGEITEPISEGELLPETYSFVRGDSKNSIVLQAKKAMADALANAWANRQEDLPVKNAAQLLILASIIEKETAVDTERSLVASVFANRLSKGMKLQTDPTVIYALTDGKQELERTLTRKDLLIDNPYNTYKYYGLPPAPICNPGRASLNAAANPEFSPYLYFVANGKGGHNFATSLKEHNDNVQSWKKVKK